MKKFIKIVFLVIIITTINIKTQAQKEESNPIKLISRIEAGYVFGGQIYDASFAYKPGYSFSITESIKVNDFVNLGIGMGHFALKSDKFLPIYLEVMGSRKTESNTPFLKFQAGYSSAWNNNENNYADYDYYGGAYINVGTGRKFKINNANLLFQLSYCHQFAKIEYKVFGGQEYESHINYDMLIFSLGFEF